MSSKKIEFLADRRAKPQRPTAALRALRHLDAARAKLETLQAARKQLKLVLVQRTDERDAALALAKDLRLRYDERGHELEEATRLVDAQAEKIAQLRAEYTALQDRVRPRQRRQSDDDGPALTVLALEKVAARSHAETPSKVPAEPAEVQTSLVRRILHRIRPDADKTSTS